MGVTQAGRRRKSATKPSPGGREDVALALALAHALPSLGKTHRPAKMPEPLRTALRRATPEQLEAVIIEATVRLRHAPSAPPSA